MQEVIHSLASRLTHLGWSLATAESCTGGLIATTCTDQAGSSAWFDRAFVTYSNEAKSQMLGVPQHLILEHGAVSEPVAKAMALGAVYHSLSDASVAVTGIAGPGGGSHEKPVGTVWIAWCVQGQVHAKIHHFSGDRQQIRQATCWVALQNLLQLLPTS